NLRSELVCRIEDVRHPLAFARVLGHRVRQRARPGRTVRSYLSSACTVALQRNRALALPLGRRADRRSISGTRTGLSGKPAATGYARRGSIVSSAMSAPATARPAHAILVV